MSDQKRCRHCGTPILADGPGGHCPRCLILLGIGEPSTSGTHEAAPASAPDFPERIGPYRILDSLGEGGMGIVYLAEQTEPIRRQVALKVIKAGMDTKQVVARFEAERQAIALMDHPSIAKVFDAGATPRGLPFFVMEYVKGEPITTYCDRQKLATGDRLELFMRICDGVQHAHQKGIIHRDLKPSNVLVAIQDGKPVPKIIDFGVAKATAQRLTEKTLFTGLGVLIGTPEYMSPEQAEMTGLDIDTRTDVYALGILLYELLAGALPFDIRELRRAGFDEIRRFIREVDPPRPSERVSTLGAASTESARLRGTEPERLVSQLRGDLDWITMKALEKDRTRRYGSPSDLAADITRHLCHEPVLASPPSAAYRARKFVRRHRFGVTAAVVGLVVPVAFAVAMVVQARKTAREAEAKARVADFLRDLFRESDPDQSRGRDVSARELLDRGAREIREGQSIDPLVRVDLTATMGGAYLGLGLYPEAEALLNETLKTCRTLRLDSPTCLRAAHDLGTIYFNQGRYREEEELATEMLAAQRRAGGPDTRETLLAMADLAGAYVGQGRGTEAEPMLREALSRQKRLLGPDDPDTIESLQTLAFLYDNQGKFAESVAVYREVFESRKRVFGPDSPRTCTAMVNLALALIERGQLQEGERLYHEVLDIERRVLGPEHRVTLGTRTNLAYFYRSTGRYSDAESIDTEVLAIQKRLLGPEQTDTLFSMNNLAADYRDQGRLKDAEAIDQEALDIRKRVFGPEHPGTLFAMGCLADDYRAQRRHQEAEALDREAYEIRRRILGPDHRDTLVSLQTLARDNREAGRHDEADELDRQILESRRRVLGSEHSDMLGSMLTVAINLKRQGRFKEAEAIDLELLEIAKRTQGPDTPITLNATISLASDYRGQARYQEAEALDRELVEIAKRVRGAENRGTLYQMRNLAEDYRLQGRHKEAESLDREVLDTMKRALGPDHPDTLISMDRLALDLINLQRYEDAATLLTESVDASTRALGSDDPRTLGAMYNLACIVLRLGDRAAALRHLRDAVEHGYSDAGFMMKDADLKSLRDDPEFRRLVSMAQKNEQRESG